jgi:effector-binding domain-containing protein
MEHKGAWSDLKFSYEKLIGEIMQNGYKTTNYCREVYHVCDFENEENNITEIQVGIEQ